MNIKSNLKDDVLHIILEGQIDSTNAPEVEKDLFGLIPSSGFNRIELDCEKLEYVTSAGLRVILALWKRFPSLALIDVIPAVYEILEMTGFSQMMEVHKVLRRISVDGCPIIGEGFTSVGVRQNKVNWFKGDIYKLRFTPKALKPSEFLKDYEKLNK